MWRLLLLGGLCAILFCGVAQAQIERKAGPRGAAEIRKPRRHEQARQERASAAQLSPAQRALAAVIAKACQAQAGLGRQNQLSAVKTAPPLVPAPPAPAAPQPKAEPKPAREPQPAAQPVANSEQPQPDTPAAPVAQPDPQAPPAPQAEKPQAQTSVDVNADAPAASAATPAKAKPQQPKPAAQPPADKPAADNRPAPPRGEQANADTSSSAATEAANNDPQTHQPPAAAVPPAKPASAVKPPPAQAKPAPQPPAPETEVAGEAPAAAAKPAPEKPAPSESSTAQAPDTTSSLDELAEARRQREPTMDATAPAAPTADEHALAAAEQPASTKVPEDRAQDAEAVAPTVPAKHEAAAKTATEDQPAASTPPPPDAAAPAGTAPVRRDPSELSSRRPQLKMTKREPSPARHSGSSPPIAAISSADVTGAAEQTAESVISHADAIPASPAAPVTSAVDSPASSKASSDSAGATGFSAPFEPRDAGTSLSQLSAPHLAAPPSAPAQESMVLPPAGQVPVEMLLPPPASNTNLIIAPLALVAAGTLSANYGSGAPIELVLPRDASAVPDYQIKPGLGEFSRGNPKKKQVALTFDDGPHPQFTSQILAVLAYYRVPATFFFTGLQAQKNPQWVRMAHQAGHEIGNHTYDHFRIPKLPRKEQEYQIDEYQRLIQGLTGVTPRFLRPPGGQLDKETQQLVTQRGMIVAMWDVALNDTKAGKSDRELLKTSLKGIRSGSVILAHDGIQSTIDMLPALITTMRAEGYSFVTLSQLASER